MLGWQDLVVILVIIVVSYWVAFVSGASKFIVQSFNNKGKQKKKSRGTITGEEKRKNCYIQRVRRTLLL